MIKRELKKRKELPEACKNAGLKIVAFPSDKDKIPQTPEMKANYVPDHPCRTYICGSSKSGKSTLLINLFTRFYRDYFDIIFLFSPTSQIDSLVSYLDLDDDRIFDELDISKLKQIIDNQKKEVIDRFDKDVSKALKICILFDDCVSEKEFIKSSPFKKLCISARHYGISIFFLGQKYNMAPTYLRTNSSHVMYFAGNGDENDAIIDDHTPPRHTKKEFREILNYCTEKRFDFIYMRCDIDPMEKFCKNLEETIILQK